MALTPLATYHNTTSYADACQTSNITFQDWLNMGDKVKYLLSLGAVRERAKVVGEAAQANKLSHFDVHEERLGEVADFVTKVIRVCIQDFISTYLGL